MVTKNNRATLNVTKEFKQDLDKMRLNNESYEDILKREIGGYIKPLINVNEPVAFELRGKYRNQEDSKLYVYWSELKEANVGDFWAVNDADDCLHRETASVIFKDEISVLVRFRTISRHNNVKFYDVEVVSYNFLV